MNKFILGRLPIIDQSKHDPEIQLGEAMSKGDGGSWMTKRRSQHWKSHPNVGDGPQCSVFGASHTTCRQLGWWVSLFTTVDVSARTIFGRSFVDLVSFRSFMRLASCLFCFWILESFIYFLSLNSPPIWFNLE